MENRDTFESASQRVLYTHLRSLAEPRTPAEAELHSFFHELYRQMYVQPSLFGLPVSADAWVEGGEPDHTKRLAEVNRVLDRPRKAISQMLDYLRGVGCAGQLEGERMLIEAREHEALLASTKVKPRLLLGLSAVGWTITEGDGQVMVHCETFPQLMPALMTLAQAVSAFSDEKLARFHFARADFRALQPGYVPDVLDLFRILDPKSVLYLLDLHQYLTQLKYKATVEIYGVQMWSVKYQGNRKIKSTPLYQVEFQDRFRDPLRVFIKCASANRLVDLIPQQSPRLQQDFFNRTLRCTNCTWCDSRKSLGPAEISVGGQQKKICWYVMSDLPRLDENVVGLVKEYIHLHETLAPL